MIVTRPALFGRTACAVALYKKKLSLRWVAFLTIGQLARQAGDIQRGFLAGHLARLAGGFASERRLDNLAHDLAGLIGVFLEPLSEFFVDQVLNCRPHFGTDQFVFRLTGEFWVGHLDGEHASQPFAGIVARERDLFLFQDTAGIGVKIDRAGHRAAKASKVRPTIALRDVVGKGQHHFIVTVIPPHRGFDGDTVTLSGDENRFGDHRGFRAVEITHEFAHAAFVEQI